jgi:hypothetical protein
MCRIKSRTGASSLAAQHRRLHIATDSSQQFVLEEFAQACQHAAHRGLADVDARSGPRDVLFLQQRVERQQQVQV